MPTNIVDIICIAVLIISVLYGMYRGFISGILSLAGLIASIAGAFVLTPNLSGILKGNETCSSGRCRPPSVRRRFPPSSASRS